jgi:hypothetical protein
MTSRRAMDQGWRYEPSKLFWQWDSGHQRFGVRHPDMPSVQALGFPSTFMGWTMDEARACCAAENAVLDTQAATSAAQTMPSLEETAWQDPTHWSGSDPRCLACWANGWPCPVGEARRWSDEQEEESWPPRPLLRCMHCDTPEEHNSTHPCLPGWYHGYVTRPAVTTLAQQMWEWQHYNPMAPQQTWPCLARFLGDD